MKKIPKNIWSSSTSLLTCLSLLLEQEVSLSRVDEEVTAPTETVQKVDIEELKKQAFQPRTD